MLILLRKNLDLHSSKSKHFLELEDLHLCNWDNQNHTHFDRSGGKSNILDLMITNSKEKVTKFEIDENLEYTPYRPGKHESRFHNLFILKKI